MLKYEKQIKAMLYGDRDVALRAKRQLTAAAARMSKTNPAEARLLRSIYSRIKIRRR